EREDDRGGRRRRRRSGEQPATAAPSMSAATTSPDAPTTSPDAPTTSPDAPTASADAPTAPARAPFEPLPPPPLPQDEGSESPRGKSMPELPPMDELDTGWDLGDSDPTASEEPAPPSSSEMAGDSATGGDGIDEPGWD